MPHFYFWALSVLEKDKKTDSAHVSVCVLAAVTQGGVDVVTGRPV